MYGDERENVAGVQTRGYEQGAALKQQACDQSPSGLGALGGYKQAETMYQRNSIRRRVERTIAEFEGSIKRAGAAQRVKQIIDAHPEFAELLDLLGEF